jgi:hypothetical protein
LIPALVRYPSKDPVGAERGSVLSTPTTLANEVGEVTVSPDHVTEPAPATRVGGSGEHPVDSYNQPCFARGERVPINEPRPGKFVVRAAGEGDTGEKTRNP